MMKTSTAPSTWSGTKAAQFSTDRTWGIQLDGPLEVLGVESMRETR